MTTTSRVGAIWVVGLAAVALAAGPMRAAGLSETLYNTIRANDLDRLEAILKQGADANAKDDHGVTPLMYAAAVGSLDAMKLLLKSHATPNAVNMFGSTALIWSATDIQKVRLLLDHGADVKAVTKKGRTALQVAALSDRSAEIVRLLIAKGADVKSVDSMMMTTLNAAALGNDTETVRMLVDAGVDVNATGPLMAADAIVGESPLMNAAYNGNLAAVKLLLAKGASVNLASSRNKNHQVKNGPIGLGGFTPLALAAAFGPAEVVKALLDSGASVDVKDIRGMTPLMLAVATDRQNPNIIRMLPAKGAAVNTRSGAGETAHDWSRKIGNAWAMKTLKPEGHAEDPVEEAHLPGPAPAALKPAIERSVRLLETSSDRFFRDGGCVACHVPTRTTNGSPRRLRRGRSWRSRMPCSKLGCGGSGRVLRVVGRLHGGID